MRPTKRSVFAIVVSAFLCVALVAFAQRKPDTGYLNRRSPDFTGLVAAWSMYPGTTVVNDLVGTATMTLSNHASGVATSDGTYGNYYELDGSNDYFSSGVTGAPFNFTHTSAFTFEAWVYFVSIRAANSADMAIFSKMTASGSFPGFDFGVNVFAACGHAKVHLWLINTFASNNIHKCGGTTLSTGQWYHLAVTKSTSTNASGVNLYVNGALEGSPTTEYNNLTSSFDSATGANIGRRSVTGNESNMRISSLRVYNVERTAAQIARAASLNTAWELYRPQRPRAIYYATTPG